MYSAMLTGICLSVLVSVLNTRLLGAEGYGDFKFIQNLFTFTVTCITLGVFVSGARLIASETNSVDKKRLYGGMLFFIVLIYVFLAVGFYLFSYIQADIFKKDLGGAIRLCLPLMFAMPMIICSENVLKGDNRIYELALFRVMPTAIYLVFAYLTHVLLSLTVEKALIINMSSAAIVSAVVMYRSYPSFTNIKSTVVRIYEESKSYGFNVYLGVVASVATTTLGGISLAYYIDNVAVGYFMLAMTMTQPLTMVSTSIGLSLFKRFANTDVIGYKAFLATCLISFSSLLVYLLIIEDVILFLYSDDFLPVVSLCLVMAVGATFQGIGGFINNFICARGYGRIARNTAFVRGAINITGYTVGVTYFGLQGASYTVLSSGMIYMLIMLLSYHFIKNKTKPLVEQ